MKTNQSKIGYKATENGVCIKFKYEVGETYRKHSAPIMCAFGFHYCKDIDSTLKYYKYKKGITKIFEIEDLGTTITGDDKCVTNKIKIVREIPVSEWNDLMKHNKFDKNGNQTLKTLRNGMQYMYKYNAKNQRIRFEDSDGFVETYRYDKDGERTSKIISR